VLLNFYQFEKEREIKSAKFYFGGLSNHPLIQRNLNCKAKIPNKSNRWILSAAGRLKLRKLKESKIERGGIRIMMCSILISI